MQQLWLSYPALGSYIPNLGRLLASDNLVKMDSLEKSRYGMRDNSLGHMPSKY